MIFRNPAGAPELACDECGCRWYDRMRGACYECGAAVSAEARAEFERALQAFGARQAEGAAPPEAGEAAPQQAAT
ncbi:MAG: hypothetical protein IT502_07215 [Rubrivivax sp.]|nr:hypothetical protein [Rubrivivax sp.]